VGLSASAERLVSSVIVAAESASIRMFNRPVCDLDLLSFCSQMENFFTKRSF